MNFEFLLRCMFCGCERKYDSDSQVLNVKDLLENTSWGRATIKTAEKKEIGWICDKCLEKVKENGCD